MKSERKLTVDIFLKYGFYTIIRMGGDSGLPGLKKLERQNLAISSFKNGQILKNEKRPNFLQKNC